jgi:hypothetical protein
LHLHAQHETGVDQTAVKNHAAGATIPVAASFLGAGETQPVPKDLQQGFTRLAEKLDIFAVETGFHMDFRWHRFLLLRSYEGNTILMQM